MSAAARMVRGDRPSQADLMALARRIVHLLILGGFLLVLSESVRAEYDPSRCPEARNAAASLIAGNALDREPGLSSADQQVDLVCTSCCPSPIALPILPPPSPPMDLAPAAPGPWAGIEIPLLVLYESLRPPRA